MAGQGISFTLVTLEPCGINLPHIHPRATEQIYVIEGEHGKLRTAFAEENGGRVISNDIGRGETTFFPTGLIHYQQNLGCKTATFLAALSSDDPGVVTITTRFFALPSGALKSSLNQDQTIVDTLVAGLPSNPAKGRQQCYEACGLTWGEGH